MRATEVLRVALDCHVAAPEGELLPQISRQEKNGWRRPTRSGTKISKRSFGGKREASIGAAHTATWNTATWQDDARTVNGQTQVHGSIVTMPYLTLLYLYTATDCISRGGTQVHGNGWHLAPGSVHPECSSSSRCMRLPQCSGASRVRPFQKWTVTLRACSRRHSGPSRDSSHGPK